MPEKLSFETDCIDVKGVALHERNLLSFLARRVVFLSNACILWTLTHVIIHDLLSAQATAKLRAILEGAPGYQMSCLLSIHFAC